MVKYRMSKIDLNMDKLLREVQLKRLQMGKDKLKPASKTRLSLAMARQYNKYPKLKKELIEADLK